MSRAAIGGIGAGAVYGTCVGNALKWFPDRRGLAAGLTAAGFGAGSALTIIPIQTMIADQRLRGDLPLVRPRPGRWSSSCSRWLLRAPQPGEVPAVDAPCSSPARDYTPLRDAAHADLLGACT